MKKNEKSCIWRLEAIIGVPLEVGGPPAGNCRWKLADRPLGIAIFQWAGRDHRDHRDHREMASHACAPGHWLDRRHWDNGRLARCVDCKWTANGRQRSAHGLKMQRARCALSQCGYSQCEAPPRRNPGGPGGPGGPGSRLKSREAARAYLATGPPPRWRRSQSAPCAPP